MKKPKLPTTKKAATQEVVKEMACRIMGQEQGTISYYGFRLIYSLAMLSIEREKYFPHSLQLARDAFLSHKKPIDDGDYGRECLEELSGCIQDWNKLVGDIRDGEYTLTLDDFKPDNDEDDQEGLIDFL